MHGFQDHHLGPAGSGQQQAICAVHQGPVPACASVGSTPPPVCSCLHETPNKQSSACRAPNGMQAITGCAFFKVASADTGCGGLPVFCYPGDYPKIITPGVLLTANVCGRGQNNGCQGIAPAMRCVSTTMSATRDQLAEAVKDSKYIPAVKEPQEAALSMSHMSGGSVETHSRSTTHAEGCLVLSWR